MEDLYATAELQVIPLGDGVSVRAQIQQVIAILDEFDLILQTHASGTNIEGHMHTILQALEKVHIELHNSGSIRLISYLKLESRTDKKSTLAGKKL